MPDILLVAFFKYLDKTQLLDYFLYVELFCS